MIEPNIAIYLLTAVLGLLFGSFCNVCILRIPQKRTIARGRSHCMHCNKTLLWWELFPLFSYIALGGKCSACKGKISAQYPIVELLNAALWLLIVWQYGVSIDALLGCALCSALLVMSVIDGRTLEIPPGISAFIAILGALRLAFNLEHYATHLIGLFAVSGLLFALVFFSGGGAMGGGDVKLMAGCGLFVGAPRIIMAFMIACILGAIIHSIRMRVFGAGRELAFGPYLAGGVLIAFIFGQQILTFVFGEMATVIPGM